MRNLLFIWLLAIPFVSFAQDFPEKPDRLVNDYAGALSSSEENALETKLVTLDNETSIQIAIVILKTLDGYPIDDYTVTLFNKWKVGDEKYDNGVMILMSYKEHKLWITSGYGVEGSLPDAIIKRIIENEIVPRFKQEDYSGGLDAGVDAIILATRGEYEGKGHGGKKESPVGGFFIILTIFAIIWFFKAMQVRRYARLNNMGFWAAWMLLNASNRNHGGSWSNFSGGGGGFGGGGFGGFGGGSSGGGGAGGSW